MLNVVTGPYPVWRRRVLCAVAAASGLLAVALTLQGWPLRLHVPGGILAYEFAWSGARAQEILTTWRELLPVVRMQLLWDFPFLLLYPLAFSLACARLAWARHGRQASIGAFLSVAVLFAAPLDAIENLALLTMLSHVPTNGLARTAAVCAGAKFSLLLAAFAFLVVVSLLPHIRKRAA